MLKNLSSLTHKIGDKIYTLYCDMDSPIEHVKEALCKFIGHVDKIDENVKAAQAKAEEEKAAAEAKPVEPEKVE